MQAHHSKIAKQAAIVSDRVSLRDMAFNFALLALAYTLLIKTGFNVWSCIAAFVMVSKAQQSLMVSGHEALHYLLFKNKKLNDLAGNLVCSAPMGVCYHRTRASHLAHHRELLTEQDEELDFHLASPTRGTFLRHLITPLFGSYLIKGGMRLIGKKAQKRAKPNYKLTDEQKRADFLSVVLTSLALFALLSLIDWRLYVFFWIAPLATLTAFFHKAKTFLDHARMADEAEGTLYTYEPGWLDRVFFSTQQHLHAAHHLFPYVPYHQFFQLRSVLGEIPVVRPRGGYFAALREYLLRIGEFQVHNG